MPRRRINPRLVALLVYALAVNAILWAQTAVAAIDARHATCGPATITAQLATQPLDGLGAHVCCDLACAVQGTLASPPAASAVLERAASALPAIISITAAPTNRTVPPNARGPPISL